MKNFLLYQHLQEHEKLLNKVRNKQPIGPDDLYYMTRFIDALPYEVKVKIAHLQLRLELNNIIKIIDQILPK